MVEKVDNTADESVDHSVDKALDKGAPPSGPVAVLTLRVRYAETDQMGVVHHANYLVWFEAARSEFCRMRGIDYGQMERDGMILPVVEARCRYQMPALYEDEVDVTATVVEIRRSVMKIQYKVTRGSDTLATGETLQILLDSTTRRPKKFPPELAQRFLHGQ